jgi:mRNA interferase MazF
MPATVRWQKMKRERLKPLSYPKQQSETQAMKRGEVWWVNFSPSIGGEIKKTRPAVILSNDISNKYLNRVQVVPLTSKIGKVYPSEAYVTLSGRQSKAIADQITTVNKLRLINSIGSLSQSDLAAVESAVRTQLLL